MWKSSSFLRNSWPSASQIRRARTSQQRNRTSKTTRGTLNFAFDKAGNRTLQTFGTGTQAITSAFTVGNDMNQLDRVAKGPMGAFEFHYDAEGNRISKFVNETDGRGEAEGTTGYGWDGKNRLTQVTLPDTTTVNYAYDYQNRLVSRTQNSALSTFLYGSGNQVLEETLNGSRLALYGWGADGLASRSDANGQTLFYLKDALGSVMAIVDERGAVVQSYEFSAYGESLSGKDAVNAFRFVGGAGGYTDDATGLVQFWNRWYDPQVGKWVSEDPIRQAGGVNLYGYVGNRPALYYDSTGLLAIACRASIAGAIGFFGWNASAGFAFGDGGFQWLASTGPSYGLGVAAGPALSFTGGTTNDFREPGADGCVGPLCAGGSGITVSTPSPFVGLNISVDPNDPKVDGSRR
jgi:RHS repeat-associated protein